MFIDLTVSLFRGLLGFCNFSHLLSPSRFKSANFGEVLFFLTNLACRFSGWSLVVGVSLWCLVSSANRSTGLSFGLVSYFPVLVNFLIGSFLISISR